MLFFCEIVLTTPQGEICGKKRAHNGKKFFEALPDEKRRTIAARFGRRGKGL
jgi:hypothetical protein